MLKFILSVLFCLLPVYSFSQVLVIIVGKGSPLMDISKEHIPFIYSGEMRFYESQRIYPVDSKDTAIKQSFIENFLNKTAREYKLQWFCKVTHDATTMPLEARNSQEAMSIVAKNKGAIAYIPKEDFTEEKGAVKLYEVISK